MGLTIWGTAWRRVEERGKDERGGEGGVEGRGGNENRREEFKGKGRARSER